MMNGSLHLLDFNLKFILLTLNQLVTLISTRSECDLEVNLRLFKFVFVRINLSGQLPEEVNYIGAGLIHFKITVVQVLDSIQNQSLCL